MTKAEQLQALEEALFSGELTVRYADRQVTYRSLDEMRSLRDELNRAVLGVSAKPRRRYFQFRDESQGEQA